MCQDIILRYFEFAVLAVGAFVALFAA